MPEPVTISPQTSNPATAVAANDKLSAQVQFSPDISPLQCLTIQPKLTVGQMDDPHEKEADAVADQVMRMPEQNFIRRKCAGCEEEEKISRKPLFQNRMPLVQAKSEGSATISEGAANSIQSSRGSGSGLDGQTQSFMSNRMGSDFSGVKIHTDNEAVQLNRGLNAKAFTVGRDVYFNEGQYQPNSSQGKHLLAHELTHTLQQTGNGQAIQRVVSDAEVETEFQKWAAANNVKVNKSSSDYPHELWTFISSLIMDKSTYGPIAKPAAKDTKLLDEWTKNFEKAGIVSKWLITLKNTSPSDSVKNAADSRAFGILDFMVQAGLVSKAMGQAGGLNDDNKKSLFETILKNPSSASSTELETITAFQCSGIADPASVPIVQAFTDGNHSPLKKLDADKSKAILKILVSKYGNHDTIIDALAELFMFNPSIRTAISDALMASDFGSPELLFKVLKHKFFIEPEYGASVLGTLKPGDMTTDDYEKKRMKDDMPWVYNYKQKYYVQYLIDLAKSQGITIPSPGSMNFAGLKPWLETNTEKIAEAAKKKYPSDQNAIFEIYKNIADIFFYHIPHDRDAVPDLEGKISHLKEGAPSKKRFEADCDVFATYAMRLFYNAGFEPIGYMTFVPTGADASRAAHVAALMRKDGKYYVINNKGILETNVSETAANVKKEEAIKRVRKLAFEDAYGDPRPTILKIYYADAGPKGQMSKLFKDQDSSLERSDL